MDPEATFMILNDEAADAVARDFAALNLLVWLAKGGHAPFNANPARALIETVERCEDRLIGAIA